MKKDVVKSVFLKIFLILVIFLLILPFLTTFNELLTAIVLKIGWYRVIENYLLPFETRMIVVVVRSLGFEAIASSGTISILRNGIWEKIIISWNCIGWQSIIVLGATLVTGLQGEHSGFSKFVCVLMGILGTFLVNILRISLVAILIIFIRGIPAAVIHDYSSVVILILWLFFFWWFSYSFVLEERKGR